MAAPACRHRGCSTVYARSTASPVHAPLPRPRSCRRAKLQTRASIADERSSLESPRVEFLGAEGGEYRLRGSLTCDADASTVWRVLTDYDALPRVFSNVASAHVARRSPELLVRQECRWEFLVFSGSFGLLLRVAEDPSSLQLTFDLVQPTSFTREFTGGWTITPQPGGGCHVEHLQRVAPALSPPAVMSDYTGKIFLAQVSRVLQELEQEVERVAAAEAAADGAIEQQRVTVDVAA